MLFPVEQAFVGRDEKRAPLKTPSWEASTVAEKKRTEGVMHVQSCFACENFFFSPTRCRTLRLRLLFSSMRNVV